jgi:FMN phosphatase YigB (HAD superfamily)
MHHKPVPPAAGSSPIQAVIFDIGGVLLRTEDRVPRQQWEAKLGLPPGGAEALVFNSADGQKAQCGAISEPELWRWIGSHLGLTAEETAAFRTGFWAGDRLDVTLVALIRQLKVRYQTACSLSFKSGNHPHPSPLPQRERGPDSLPLAGGGLD